MIDRPEWLTCISIGNPYESLCGRFGMQFRFVDRAHADSEVEHGGRLVPCPECLKKSRIDGGYTA